MFPSLPSLSSLAAVFPMSGIDIAFYVVAFIMVVTAICTVAVKNILQSAIFLIASFVGTTVLYLLLHAEFNALAQIMVYIGGVVIFVIFTILLTSHLGEEAFSTKMPRFFAAFALSIVFIAIMVKCLVPMPELVTAAATAPEGFASLKAMAMRLMGYDISGFIIPFEAVSILLLATLIGAITIARRSPEQDANKEGK